VLRLFEDLPLVVEIIVAEDKIEAFMPYLDEVIGEGLITMEKVRVITYRHSPD
jgi:PII-like signaling protein